MESKRILNVACGVALAFYKNDRWTWKTLAVEKDGFVHWLLPPKDGQESADGRR